MINWELKNCCKHDQKVFLATIGIFTVVILSLWRTVLLTPFKLITVFLHETSHAIACKLTCGQWWLDPNNRKALDGLMASEIKIAAGLPCPDVRLSKSSNGDTLPPSYLINGISRLGAGLFFF